MASGSWDFSIASNKLQGRISWSSTSNGSSANTSNITATLYAKRTDGYTTTGQSWSGYVKIQGKDNSNQANISFSSSVSVGSSWVQMAQVTLNNAKHNDDGSGSATISGSVTGPSGTSLAGITSSGSSGVTLDKIARYTSIKSFTVSKRNETSFTFNWQTADTIDYAWYSTNNGSSYTGVDVTDGTSGSFTVSGLSPSTTYNCKLRVRRKDSQLNTDSAVVSQTTYAVPGISLVSKTETSVTMKWTCDTAASKIRYSTNNGSSWSSYINVSGTSGNQTISGLSANTGYNFKIEVTRSATNTAYSSGTSYQTTYNWPNCTAAPDFTIGNNVALTLYNPLGRNVSIQMWSHVSQGFINTTAVTTTGTSYTFPASNYNTQLYNSIPSTTKSQYNIDVTYDGHKMTKAGGYYSINASTVKPSFSTFAYRDTDTSALIQAIDNDQIIVQNVSNVNLVISSANKMIPSTGASAATSTNSKYVATFSNLSKTQAYSSSDIDVNMGIPTGKGNQTFSVTAYDARGTQQSATPKTINIIEYAAPEVNPSLQRLNNFETSTTFSVSGKFSKVTVGSTDMNYIGSVQYRYKESTSSTWGSWTPMTISSQGNGEYNTNTITIDCDNTKQFDFQFQVTDQAKTTTVSRTLSIGEPLMFLYTNGKLELNANSEVAGTLAGALDVTSSDLAIKQTHATTGKAIGFGVGGGGTNRGIWDFVQQKWMLYDNDSNIYLNKFTRIPGAAADKPLMVRGIAGCDSTATTAGELHLNYGVDAPVKFGKEATTYVQASGMIRGTQAGSWVKDRDNSLVRNTYNGSGAYAPVICQGTMNGSWTIGCLSGENNLTFNYETDTKYNNNTNTAQRVTLTPDGYFSGNCNGSNWANYPSGFSSKASSQTWGSQTGTFLTGWQDSTGGSIAFRRDNPSSGQTSMILDGTVYVNEGRNRCYGGKDLYNNSTGTNGTITLSETAANFTFIEIFYRKGDGGGTHSVKVDTGKNMTSISIIAGIPIGTTSAQIHIDTLAISGTSLTHAANYGINLYTTPRVEIFTANEMRVTRVVGWR